RLDGRYVTLGTWESGKAIDISPPSHSLPAGTAAEVPLADLCQPNFTALVSIDRRGPHGSTQCHNPTPTGGYRDAHSHHTPHTPLRAPTHPGSFAGRVWGRLPPELAEPPVRARLLGDSAQANAYAVRAEQRNPRWSSVFDLHTRRVVAFKDGKHYQELTHDPV